jgi:hypothetical protein
MKSNLEKLKTQIEKMIENGEIFLEKDIEAIQIIQEKYKSQYSAEEVCSVIEEFKKHNSLKESIAEILKNEGEFETSEEKCPKCGKNPCKCDDGGNELP